MTESKLRLLRPVERAARSRQVVIRQPRRRRRAFGLGAAVPERPVCTSSARGARPGAEMAAPGEVVAVVRARGADAAGKGGVKVCVAEHAAVGEIVLAVLKVAPPGRVRRGALVC